jgi:L-2-hydroxyglutarate oxidase LhgO
MAESVECVVIGAGVVGLAIGRALAAAGREVIVLEKNVQIGEETSSRNSEVIHAGIYYPSGSLKARLCVEGKRLLYDYLEAKGIAYQRIGKVIVAVDESQLPRLADIARQGRANGVEDLAPLDRSALRQMEPHVRGVGGIWSPSTGIFDTHAYMLSLQADFEARGGVVALHAALTCSTEQSNGIGLRIDDGEETTELVAGSVVNAAGLHASRVAAMLPTPSDETIPRTSYARGNYFQLVGESPFAHLVYPLPTEGGLGVHATLDLAGSVRFGPDVEWIDTIAYEVDAARAADFYDAIREYWPELPDGSLQPAYSGIRPKLSLRGEPAADFRVVRSVHRGRALSIQLFGIESPGLTASLAIGKYVAQLCG